MESDPAAGGALQAQVDGDWGYVCDDYFDYDNNAASVACKQLGASLGRPELAAGGVHCDTSIDCSSTPTIPGSRHDCSYSLDDVQCPTGEESTLQQCDFVGAYDHNCGQSEGVFLVCGANAVCPPPAPIAGIRLNPFAADGQYWEGDYSSGLLEVGTLAAGESEVVWGPVCDDYFDMDDRQVEVVCRQLGFVGPAVGTVPAGYTPSYGR